MTAHVGESFGIEGDKLFVAVITPALHYSMGGLRISSSGQILRATGDSAVPFQAIPGLFGAGEVTGKQPRTNWGAKTFRFDDPWNVFEFEKAMQDRQKRNKTDKPASLPFRHGFSLALSLTNTLQFVLFDTRERDHCELMVTAVVKLPELSVALFPPFVFLLYDPRCGPVRSGGMHGDNRLAGNSLLECAVMGKVAGERAASVTIAGRVSPLLPDAWSTLTVSHLETRPHPHYIVAAVELPSASSTVRQRTPEQQNQS